MIVVADTSPLRYLFVIGEIHLLPLLYQRILVPRDVEAELTAPHSPRALAEWMGDAPEWLEVREPHASTHPQLGHLDAGERAAIELALACSISTVLMDELKGRRSAEALHLIVRGTVGVLAEGARLGLVDLPLALDKLQQQRFYMSETIKRQILIEYDQGSNP